MALEVDGVVKWVNGDGHSTKFWKDNWILNCDVLADNFAHIVPHIEDDIPSQVNVERLIGIGGN